MYGCRGVRRSIQSRKGRFTSTRYAGLWGPARRRGSLTRPHASRTEADVSGSARPAPAATRRAQHGGDRAEQKKARARTLYARRRPWPAPSPAKFDVGSRTSNSLRKPCPHAKCPAIAPAHRTLGEIRVRDRTSNRAREPLQAKARAGLRSTPDGGRSRRLGSFFRFDYLGLSRRC